MFEGGNASSSDDSLQSNYSRCKNKETFRRPLKFPLKYIKNLARANLLNYVKNKNNQKSKMSWLKVEE